jgi:hypothetical protein
MRYLTDLGEPQFAAGFPGAVVGHGLAQLRIAGNAAYQKQVSVHTSGVRVLIDIDFTR